MTNFTTNLIEETLQQASFSPVARVNRKELSPEQNREINTLENIVTFGQDSISLFDNLVYTMKGLPSQSQYVEAGLPLMIDWLAENRPEIIITDIVKEGLKLRMTRTYMSKVTEIHLDCIFKEYLSDMKVTTFPMLDSVMGVDLVVEDDTKRYYVHVTSNTPFANKMLLQKENRGGMRMGKTFIEYSRDFSGDLILRYDTHTESDTTMIVNGFPLFKPEFIEGRFFIASRQSGIGEDLSVKYSKLQHFKDWARTNLNMKISSI